MTEIHVDGRRFEGADRAETYGELLAVLDPALARASRIVTVVRVDGVEEPAFREPGTLGRLLAATRVDVESTAVRDLAHDALADSVRLMPAVADAARQTGERLAQADATVDAASLAELAEGLTLLVTLVQTAQEWAEAGGGRRVDWLGEHVVQVAHCIDALNEAQQDADWVSVADTLLYDLVPALDAWHATVSAALDGFAGSADALNHAPQH